MKRLLLLFVVAFFAVTTAPRASAAIGISVFYDSLDPYGQWIEAADYGYVWHPADVDADWRPYTVGHWVFTDVGWTWVSDEPFGWATYHYGRWVNLVDTGWAWVPDTEWAPAWVSWRRSPQHVGWAPLPPEARFRTPTTISAWVDGYYDIGPSYYNFVEVRQFGAPRLRDVVLPARENVTIVNETKNITNITYVNNVVHNGGPEYDAITRESAQPIRRLKLERQNEIQANTGPLRAEGLRPRVEGDVLRVTAPPIEASPQAAPKRVARKIETVEVNRGWKDVGEKGQADQLRARLKAEAKPPANLPLKPKFGRVMAKEGERPEKAAPATGAPAAVAGSENAPAATTQKPSRRTAEAAGQADRKGRGKNAPAVGTEPVATTEPDETAAPGSTRPGKNAKKTQSRETAEPAERPGAPGEKAGERLGRKNGKGGGRDLVKPEPNGATESASPGGPERPGRNGRGKPVSEPGSNATTNAAADVEKAGRREARRDAERPVPGRAAAGRENAREAGAGRGPGTPAATDEGKAGGGERKKEKKNEPEAQ